MTGAQIAGHYLIAYDLVKTAQKAAKLAEMALELGADDDPRVRGFGETIVGAVRQVTEQFGVAPFVAQAIVYDTLVEKVHEIDARRQAQGAT